MCPTFHTSSKDLLLFFLIFMASCSNKKAGRIPEHVAVDTINVSNIVSSEESSTDSIYESPLSHAVRLLTQYNKDTVYITLLDSFHFAIGNYSPNVIFNDNNFDRYQKNIQNHYEAFFEMVNDTSKLGIFSTDSITMLTKSDFAIIYLYECSELSALDVFGYYFCFSDLQHSPYGVGFISDIRRNKSKIIQNLRKGFEKHTRFR